jgi:hypothetical protein
MGTVARRWARLVPVDRADATQLLRVGDHRLVRLAARDAAVILARHLAVPATATASDVTVEERDGSIVVGWCDGSTTRWPRAAVRFAVRFELQPDQPGWSMVTAAAAPSGSPVGPAGLGPTQRSLLVRTFLERLAFRLRREDHVVPASAMTGPPAADQPSEALPRRSGRVSGPRLGTAPVR